jgi:hypothetical protein
MTPNPPQERRMSTSLNEPPSVDKGTIKTFGPLGPKYEVGTPVRQLPDGDWMIQIVLVETGEETEYRYSQLRADPEAL